MKAIYQLLYNAEVIKASSMQSNVVEHLDIDQLWNIVQKQL